MAMPSHSLAFIRLTSETYFWKVSPKASMAIVQPCKAQNMLSCFHFAPFPQLSLRHKEPFGRRARLLNPHFPFSMP